MTNSLNFIRPEWPAPVGVSALTTTRGSNETPSSSYDFFNLAAHVNDDPLAVEKNRAQLYRQAQLAAPPFWLTQTHSTRVVELQAGVSSNRDADASFTRQPNQVCAVLTADCLPIVICHATEPSVAAIHAGWRGMHDGIIANTLRHLNRPTNQLLAWLGPAISAKHYEIGDELYQRFIQKDSNYAAAFSKPTTHWHLDLYRLATIQLQQLGVKQIYGGDYCTYQEPQRFYSYRRDGQNTGRMATIVWIS